MIDIIHFLNWYLIVLILGLVSFPIGFRFFPQLTSKGYALVRPLGLLIWAYVFWLLTSFGVLQNNVGGVLFAFIVLLGLSIWAASNGKWKEILAWGKENIKTVLTMELLFLFAFALWTIIRAANPEITNTEKPMELAFINSILKTPSFPPQDPWLSGYSISYYYFGYVMVSMLIRISGIPSSIAFNLSISLWFGLSALAVYGIIFDLLTSRNGLKNRLNAGDRVKSLRIARAGGFLGPMFVLIVSCLEGVLEFLYARGVFWKTDATGTIVSKFWTWLNISELDVSPSQPFSWIPSRPATWMWWRGSRVIQDLSITNKKIEIIDEFPFFSYLLADLHPHLLAMPFVLLAIGVCLNLYFSAGSFRGEGKSIIDRFKKWAKCWEFWVIALILGSLGFINTWDFPIYVALFCFVLFFKDSLEFGLNWKRAGEYIQNGFLFGISGILLFLPFYLGFKSQAGGILPSLEYMTRGVHFWILFGALLIPISFWLFYQLRQKDMSGKLLEGLKVSAILFGFIWLSSILFGLLIYRFNQIGPIWIESTNGFISSMGAQIQIAGQAFSGLHENGSSSVVILTSILRRINSPGTWLTLAVMFGLTWGLIAGKVTKIKIELGNAELNLPKEEAERNPKYFVLILILLGLVLTTFPEYFYLRDQFGSRMNTIFKFYFQAWILWGIVAAYASVELLTRLLSWKRNIFCFILAVTLLGGLAYPVIMIWEKTNRFNPIIWTLDGNEYLARENPDDYAAINWLRTEPLGIVAEAIGGSYQGEFARVSTRTGFPTVLGWPGHESQWRGGWNEIGSRESDIELLYKTNSWTEALNVIQKYSIRYIYVGNTEKSLYKPNTDKFQQNLPVVYQNSGVIIFEVPSTIGVQIQ